MFFYICPSQPMNQTRMNWTLILLFSTFGVIMGFLAVNGYTHKIEPFLWLLFALAAALTVSKNVDDKVFMHGFIIGLSWGILNGVIQSAFFDQYLANNPHLSANFNKITFMNPRYIGLLSGPVIGLITGLVLGGISLLCGKIWR
jgi:hypothetical protein